MEPDLDIGADDKWDDIANFFGYDTDIGNSRLTSATYYACMLIRCNAIAKLPVKLMQETAEGFQKASKHPMYKLLKNRPNPFTTPHDFMWATEFQRLECGNAFWVMGTSKGRVKALYLLDSSRVEIIVDNSNLLDDKNAVYYSYTDPRLGQVIYTNDNIVHFKNFSRNGIKGTSIRRYLSDVIESEQFARKLIKSKNKEGLQDPIVVTYTGDINEAQKLRIRKKFADMGGAKNAGKVIPIPTDFDVKQLETKLVNSQFFQLQGLTTRQIANAFGVKGFQLNDMEKSTYNNVEQQNKAFYSDTLQNALTEYEQEMDYKLLAMREQESYFWNFNVDAILRGDIESRYRAYNTGILGGFLKIAEAREKENLPHEEGTDQLIIGNGASIPLVDLGKQYTKQKEGGGEPE